MSVSYNTVKFMCDLTENLRPRPEMSISQWADRHMVLPEGSSEAGRYSSDTIPFQKGIMDAIADPEVTSVSVMASSQVGKTTIVMCGIGYYIDYEPATQMLVVPTIADSERFSKTRFAKMIADIPELREKVADPKARGSNNTISLKSYPGGTIALSGANSPSSLASDPRRIIWMDETDRFPESAGSEGNPIILAETRATSYWNKKYIKTSTPTVKGRSKIEDAYNKGSQEVWSAKCPECGAWQPYSFQRIDFDSVSMACESCGCLISEMRWKQSEHKWIAKHPERKRNRSFRLNQLASPFVEWQDIIDRFKSANERLKKYHDPEDLKVFVNTVLGETWDETEHVDNAVSDETLQARAEHYNADLPDGVILLTAAVDVQDDRFEIEVRGWAREYETWGIVKTELYGDLVKKAIWDELEEYLSQVFHFEDGRELGIAGFAIDTGGHHTNSVYKWIKTMKAKGKKCYGVKGYAGKADLLLLHKKTVVEITEERPNGKKVVVDHTVIQIVGVDSGKEDITNRLKIQEPGAGYCHYPEDTRRGYGNEYYKGLTSESKIVKKVNGVYKPVWVKKSGARNEPLDLFNYNYVVEEILRPNWDALEAKLENGINYVAGVQRKKKTTVRRTIGGMEL